MKKNNRVPYTQEQLSDPSDPQRLNAILQELINLATSGKQLTQVEYNYACSAIEIARTDDGRKINCGFCDDYRFRILLLKYFADLSVFNNAVDEHGRHIPYNQRVKDVEALETYCKEWLIVINDERHRELTRQEAAIEGREQLRKLRKLPEFSEFGFFRRSSFYLKREMAVVLKNKFIYLHTLEMFDYWREADLNFQIDGHDIEYTHHSHIHIITRHFGEVISDYGMDKSFHTFEVPYNKVNLILKEIANKIAGHAAHQIVNSRRIVVRFKGKLYTIFIKRQSANVRAVSPYRVDTFYPADQEQELYKIASTLTEQVINDNISVFVRR